jgi:phosphoglycolate phosphatase
MDLRNESPRRAVVLFDIDGTLIRRAGPHHRQALIDGIRDVTGVETTLDHIPTQGMLDRDIIAQMLTDAGVGLHTVRANMPAIVNRVQDVYLKLCPDLSHKTCPGTLRLLRELQAERIPAGLVTGNLSAIAWKKMDAAGLRPYLQFGAFAEMADTRADLARLALAQATDHGWVGPQTIISLVGDHPNDVNAARRNGMRAVAVCTGVSPRSDLEASQPDQLFEDLELIGLDELLGNG